jgi:hypothetical protein
MFCLHQCVVAFNKKQEKPNFGIDDAYLKLRVDPDDYFFALLILDVPTAVQDINIAFSYN